MKKNVLIAIIVLLSTTLHAQVTQIKSNKSLKFQAPLSNSKAILVSDLDQTLWVTDGASGGTFQLSSEIAFVNDGTLINGKLIFEGNTNASGNEIYVTDGTVAGTFLLKDINTGVNGSDPDDDYAVLNGFVYFTASRPAEGRELWRTDGTINGTTIVKDIVNGPGDSNAPNSYNLFSNGSYLLFDVETAAAGNELYKSDGTSAGTVPLGDLNPGTSSSNAENFFKYNNMVLFTATDALHGSELWRTNGTVNGTSIVKDINPGTKNSSPDLNILTTILNGRVYFAADDSLHGTELWTTDGTGENTKIVKDILPGPKSSFFFSFLFLPDGNKFIFTASDSIHGIELWQSDGTENGTQILKDIAPGTDSSISIVLPPYGVDFNNLTLTFSLFQGNKFFFIAKTKETGTELYVSDGTPDGTHILKDINPGPEDGATYSYQYTSSGLFFNANDGVHGNELWKTDGTPDGTSMVADINTVIGEDGLNPGSDISFAFYIINNKVIFSATDGDDPEAYDLYVVDGSFSSLPLKLGDFTVTPKNADALLQWTTLSEENTKDFTVERSDDGAKFINIGTVGAAGNSSIKQTYHFTDAGIMNSGKEIVYYRLISEDKDGKTATSKVITLRLAASEWFVKLASNFVRSDLDVIFSGNNGNLKISIKDITGKTVGSSTTAASNGPYFSVIISAHAGNVLFSSRKE